jgi:GNAT superfamily N-acetyltransferase
MPANMRVVPANEAPWADLDLVVGKARCHGSSCYCQRFKIPASQWRDDLSAACAYRFHEQTACDDPDSPATSGILAYVDDEPAAWCNVEPRTAFECLHEARTAAKKRGEDRNDASVWAVTCVVVRTEYRRHGLTYALASAAVDFARSRGARAVEAYPMITAPGVDFTWGELHVGPHTVFEAAGFRRVAQPSKRRLVMRIDL